MNAKELTLQNIGPEVRLEIGVAGIDGFLKGLSYLNQEPRSHFAEAFLIDAACDSAAIAEAIIARFAHRSDLSFDTIDVLEDGLKQLELDFRSLLLVNPHVTDSSLAKELRSYLSFKIMDDLSDVAHGHEVRQVTRLIGKFQLSGNVATFYCATTTIGTIVIYSCRKRE